MSMNDWNPIEHQLRSWLPRTPSPRLKAQLFADPEVALESPGALAGRWAWLAPVMGCFLALMVVSSSRNGHLGYLASTRTTNWLAMVASNQSYAAYIVTGFHSGQNALQKDPIEWTNGARLPNEPATFLSPATNSLIR